jgi:prepilin-type N-terminal cleavage/methylation domain-containing protein
MDKRSIRNAIKKRKGRKGFTLLEVMVAFAIIAIVSVVMMSAFTTMANLTRQTDHVYADIQHLEAAVATGVSEDGTVVVSPMDEPTELSFQIGADSYQLPVHGLDYSTEDGTRSYRMIEIEIGSE